MSQVPLGLLLSLICCSLYFQSSFLPPPAPPTVTFLKYKCAHLLLKPLLFHGSMSLTEWFSAVMSQPFSTQSHKNTPHHTQSGSQGAGCKDGTDTPVRTCFVRRKLLCVAFRGHANPAPGQSHAPPPTSCTASSATATAAPTSCGYGHPDVCKLPGMP